MPLRKHNASIAQGQCGGGGAALIFPLACTDIPSVLQ